MAQCGIGSMLTIRGSTQSGEFLIWLECCAWTFGSGGAAIISSDCDTTRINSWAQSLLIGRIEAVKFDETCQTISISIAGAGTLVAIPTERFGYRHWSINIGSEWIVFGGGTIFKTSAGKFWATPAKLREEIESKSSEKEKGMLVSCRAEKQQSFSIDFRSSGGRWRIQVASAHWAVFKNGKILSTSAQDDFAEAVFSSKPGALNDFYLEIGTCASYVKVIWKHMYSIVAIPKGLSKFFWIENLDERVCGLVGSIT